MSDLHLLRPWWLLALVPLALLLWRIVAAGDPAAGWRRVIAPHLLPHLLIGGDRRQSAGPAWTLAALWLLLTVALAGPAWQREPSPFAADRAVLVAVVKVAPSMRTDDIQPDRLARAAQKLGDLLAARPGDDAALVAYAGSAHVVLPATSDAQLVTGFAAELDPKIMPVPGDDPAAALEAAKQVIAASRRPGAILWLADAVDPAALDGLRRWRRTNDLPVQVLALATAGPEHASLRRAADALGASFTAVTPDGTDVGSLAGRRRFALASVADGGEQRWQDAGWWLVIGIAALALVWMRPGWLPRSAAREAT